MRKMRLLFKKEGRAAYISHLDTMRTLQRAIARAQLAAKHTEGFNPHAYIAIALPLSLGYTSECEMMDFVLLDDTPGFDVVARLNRALPEGIVALKAYEDARKVREIASARYRITMEYDAGVPSRCAASLRQFFAKAPILIMKKSKRGEREVDIAGLIRALEVTEEPGAITLTATLAAGNESLNPELLVRAISQYLPDLAPDFTRYHRLTVLDASGAEFR